MEDQVIYVGAAPMKASSSSVQGEFVVRRGEPCYRISGYDQMLPFFMSIVSDSDHWMFVSSTGGLTAGRQNPEHALFPYYTVDKIHDSQDLTGSKTLILVKKGGRLYLWEPFSQRYEGIYACSRSVYKSVYGDKVTFEEANDDLGLRFSYTWSTGEKMGFVKQAEIENTSDGPIEIDVLDGIQNVLHYGIEQAMQSERSNLLDAYKKSELDEATGLGIYSLSSLVVDKPIPAESLRATTIWSTGTEVEGYLLSMRQLDGFRKGHGVKTEREVRAQRGGYFVKTVMDLQPGISRDWFIVSEINQGPEDVVELLDWLSGGVSLSDSVKDDIAEGTAHLRSIVGSADGMQRTRDLMTGTRHYSNVLFNVMRGGVFDNNNLIDRDDLRAFIMHYNKAVLDRHDAFLTALPDSLSAEELIQEVEEQSDAALERLCYEYVPLIFSRRHGDPSRPWNLFSIDLRNDDGTVKRSYQGNWRDIFQNWEALCLSFPAFTENIICKFVNASTVDGYNPYRVTRDGIDWEVMDPADPWSYIGYWGDHQIIYLLKLLEISRTHHPDLLLGLLKRDIFVYANVPYRIKAYEALLQDPHNTILYDEEEDRRIADRVHAVGADGKLVFSGDGQVYHVNLTEKLLVSILAKLSNFIPGGGIWMNTQRPEWNDANNALVGFGVSMVTLYYLRRCNRFMADLLAESGEEVIPVSEEVYFLFMSVLEAFAHYKSVLEDAISDKDRKEVMDALGGAGSAYRGVVYERGFTGIRKDLSTAQLQAFFELTLDYIDHTIQENKRDDGLYHAYNLMHVHESGVAISFLYEMLEGQVGVLSSGVLNGEETVAVLTALKASALYREDQNSYILYPDRSLPLFVDKNTLPEDAVKESTLLHTLLQDKHANLVVQDVNGKYHFNGDVRDREVLDELLDQISAEGYADPVNREREHIQALFAEQFDHASYTGRSGTFFGYEGLGSIYWHMVSKLVLAINESYFRLYDGMADDIKGQMVAYYYDIRAGIGLNKAPDLYGAFPFDPYSHTPAHAGARQPGMTGQVKEDIISRWGELGVRVEAGCIMFDPVLLRKEEFLDDVASFEYVDIHGLWHDKTLTRDTFGFTYCQVPIVYQVGVHPNIQVFYAEGHNKNIDGKMLDMQTSREIFNRTGVVESLRVDVVPLL